MMGGRTSVPRGSAHHRLAALAVTFWEERLKDAPVFATAMGIRRYDDRLADITPQGRAKVLAQRKAVLA